MNFKLWMSIAYVFYDAKHNKKNHNIRLIKFSDFQLVIYLYIGPIGILSHRSGVYSSLYYALHIIMSIIIFHLNGEYMF